MTGRQKAVVFFIVLGIVLVGAAVALNVSWMLVTWRSVATLVLGLILFALIIAGIIVYTVFLVREIRRNEQHDSFINAVTHELKTPIASIRLYLETLQQRELSDEQRREFYRVMLEDTDRLHTTVDQVLKAGMAGHKSGSQNRAFLELPVLVHESVELAKLRHHLDGDRLRCELPENGAFPSVLGDAEEIRTAVVNLLDNAVKYSAGDVHIEVTLASIPERKVQIRVRDHGVGIPRNQLKLIFRRFYRAPGRALRQIKGTGLGLYIVKSIAERHGGRVFAESEGEGRGATFTLELPAA